MSKLCPGQKAPHFRLRDQNGNDVDLLDYQERVLLLYFFPQSGMPEGVTEHCVVRDNLHELKRIDVEILAITPDPPPLNKRLDLEHDLGFPILTDSDLTISAAYGTRVAGKPGMQKGGHNVEGVLRTACLIDGHGKVIDIFYDISPRDTVKEVLELMRARAR